MTDDAPAAPPAPPTPLPEDPTASALRAALRAGRLADVVQALHRLPPVRRSELFLQLRLPERRAVLQAATPELAASILNDCDSGSLEPLMSPENLSGLAPALQLVPPDNLADILLHLPPERSARAQELLDPILREEVRKLMTFPPESAGGLMTTRYLSVPDVVTVGHALELLRAEKRADTPSYIYIVDAGGRLVGVAPLRTLLLSGPRQTIRSVMRSDVVRVPATLPQNEIVSLFTQHHFLSLPVVDAQDRLLGIVTSDDVMKALRHEAEDVIQGLTGVDPREALKETWAVTRGRLPWVGVTITGGLACAALGALFQKTLEEIVMLGVFAPLVLALGESIGSQTTSVVLATRGDRTGFFAKELTVGVLVGLIAGVAVAALSLLWHGNPRLGLLFGVAILLCVAWAALLSLLVPGALRRLGVDATIASGPLVLGLSDLSTLLVFYGGATVFRDVLLR